MPIFNTVPGLIPLKIFNGNDLITSNVNLINFTGSGVTASVGEFNNLIITVGGGGGGITVNTGSLLSTASFSNPNLTFIKGDGSTFFVNLSTLVPTSASYALTSSFSITSSLPLQGITTASVSNTTITFTKGDGTTFPITVSQSGSVATASYALFSEQALSSSYAVTASYALNVDSNPFRIATGSISASVNTGPNIFIITNNNIPLFTVSQSGVIILTTQSQELTSSAPNGGIYFTSGSFFVGLD
jgi:hypothetical protein